MREDASNLLPRSKYSLHGKICSLKNLPPNDTKIESKHNQYDEIDKHVLENIVKDHHHRIKAGQDLPAYQTAVSGVDVVHVKSINVEVHGWEPWDVAVGAKDGLLYVAGSIRQIHVAISLVFLPPLTPLFPRLRARADRQLALMISQ